MKVEIFVAGSDDAPYMPGTAYVFVEGRLHAKLRTGEGYCIESREEYATAQTPGLTRAALNAREEAAWSASQ